MFNLFLSEKLHNHLGNYWDIQGHGKGNEVFPF